MDFDECLAYRGQIYVAKVGMAREAKVYAGYNSYFYPLRERTPGEQIPKASEQIPGE